MRRTAMRTLLWLALASLTLAGCGEGAGTDGRPRTGKVTLLAAASTTSVLDEIRSVYEDEHEVEVQTSYAASSALAQQIASGAGADLFLSANQKWADFLEKEGHVARRHDLLGNRLVIVVPADADLTLDKPEDLTSLGIEKLALADPDAAPAGMYAKEALIALGLWTKLEPKVVAASDVRRAMVFVETGNAEAGIVYATDAAVSEKVKIATELPVELSTPIRYPLVLLKRGADNPAAEEFFAFLCGPRAAKVFRTYGFSVLPPPEETE